MLHWGGFCPSPSGNLPKASNEDPGQWRWIKAQSGCWTGNIGRVVPARRGEASDRDAGACIHASDPAVTGVGEEEVALCVADEIVRCGKACVRRGATVAERCIPA